MKKILKGIVAVISIFILGVAILTSVGVRNVSADDTSISPTVAKWLFAQYFSCLQNPGPRERIDTASTEQFANKTLAEVIFPAPSATAYGAAPSGTTYPLPSKDVFGVGKEAISCRDTLEGVSGKLSGILEAAGKSWDLSMSDINANQDVLEKMSYTVTNSDKVVQINLNMAKYSYTSNKIHLVWNYENDDFALDGDPVRSTTANIKITVGKLGQLSPVIERGTGDNDLLILTIKENPQRLIIERNNTLLKTITNALKQSSVTGWDNPIEIQTGGNLDTFKNNLETELSKEGNSITVEYTSYFTGTLGMNQRKKDYYVFDSSVEPIIDEGAGTEYIFPVGDSVNAALRSMEKLGHPFDSIALTDEERYALYYKYLEKTLGSLNPYENEFGIKCEKVSGYERVPLKVNGEWVNYYVNLDGVDLQEEFNDFRAENNTVTFTTITLEGILKWMDTYGAAAGAKDSDTCKTPDQPEDYDTTVIDTDADEEDLNCWNASGGMGWWTCEVIKYAQNTVKTIYREIATGFLEFRAEYLDIDGGGKAVYSTWQTFQSIANIIFVIVLLIVIFSQLTGVGIDNLGIKRILPKLIIAAVLINLSYLICMLFVDVSNIVGAGANSAFSNLAASVNKEYGGTGGASALATVMETAVIGSVSALGIVTAGIWGPVVVLPLLLGIISALIGILFFFILLGARQAGIIMLVVLSPVAFACYMLPNTKIIFDKWFKMFKGLLLLYPICGVVMGGSAFASAILMQVDTGFLGHLIAMLLGVVPFFFIPTLLKGAFAAMGNLGAKISGFGQGMSRGLTGAMRNSDTYKTARQAMFERSNRAAAGLDKNHQLTARGKRMARFGSSRFGKFIGYDKLQAKRMAADDKFREIDISSQARLQGALVESEMAENPNMDIEKVYRNRLVAARDAGDSDGMFSVIEQMKKAGVKASHIAKMTREELGDTANYGKMDEGQRANFLREFGNRYAGDFLKKDFEQMMWAVNGGYGYNSIADRNNSSINPTLKGLSGYAAGNIAIDDMKDNDVASLSAERMVELINDGKISQEQAQRVWASNNSMDDVERLILGAYARNNTRMSKSQAAEALTNGGSYSSDSSTLSSVGTTLPAGTVDTRAILRRSSQDVNIRQDEEGGQVQPVRVIAESPAPQGQGETFDWRHESNIPAPTPATEMTPEQVQQLEQQYSNDKWATGFSENITTDQLNQLNQLYEQKIDQRTADRDTYKKYQKVRDELNRRNFQEMQAKRTEQQKEQEQ